MSKWSITLGLAVVLAAGCWMAAGCNSSGCVSGATGQSFGGFGGCLGGGSTRSQISFELLGDEGTPFTATIGDTQASYVLNGNVPLTVVLVNSHPPLQMSAIKNANDSALLSLQLVYGTEIQQIASTSKPFGPVFVQTGTLQAVGPAANPDVRFLIKSPPGEEFTSLIEDSSAPSGNGFVVESTAPELSLFEGAQGKVDGQYIQLEKLGAMTVDLYINGAQVAEVTGAPNITIRQP
ncbi:MAG: hypothetical protein ABSD31_14320 [Candidatus Binataceae bacterium]|jgi:hypothetical protein